MNAAFKVLDDAVEEARDELRGLEAARRSLGCQLVVDATGKQRIELGEHKCRQSPIGYCAYDMSEGSMGTDECLFCESPEERK